MFYIACYNLLQQDKKNENPDDALNSLYKKVYNIIKIKILYTDKTYNNYLNKV